MAVAGNEGGAGGAKNIARAHRKPRARPKPTGPISPPGAVQAARGGAVKGTVRKRGPQPIVSRPRPSERNVQAAAPSARASVRKRAKRVELSAQRKRTGTDRPIIVKRRAKVARQRALADVLEAITAPREPEEEHDRGLLGDIGHAVSEAAGAAGKGITAAGEAGGKGLEALFTTDIGPLKTPKGGAGAAAAKAGANIPRDVAELTVTTPTSLAKLAATTATAPEKVPGMLVEPFKEFAKDPIGFAIDKPVTTALMFQPFVKAPGLAAGRVARLGGKVSRVREPARVAGTPVRVARTGPRGLVSGLVSARRERGAEPSILKGGKAAREVDRRVDEFYGSVEQPAVRRAHETADRQIAERGYTGEQARSHRSGVVAAARQRVNDRFAQEFGDHAEAKARLAKHRSIGSSRATPARGLRVTRRLFTGSVLPYSTKWMAGQLSEAALRSLVSGAGPTSWLRARKLMRDHPELADELMRRAVPGGFGAETLARGAAPTKTLAEEFEGAGGRIERGAKALTAAGEHPAIQAVQAANRTWRNFVFEHAAGTIERNTQTAMLGRALKDSPLMDRHVLGLSDKAIADAAKGLHETHAQVELARAVRRMYGQYTHFSPEMRNAVMYWTPFAPWFVNTARFLLHTLPVEHPAWAGLAADLDAATEEWRKEHRLSTRADHVPGYLMGSYPVGEGVSRVGHFLPFAPGEMVEDPASGVLDLVLPQFSSAVNVARGRTPFGDVNYDKPGTLERIGGTALEVGKAFGGPAGAVYGAATQGPARQFIPAYPTRPHKGKVKRKRAEPAVRVRTPVRVPTVKVPAVRIPAP